MTPELFERFVVAVESIADTMRKRFDLDHPPYTEPEEAEVFVRGERAPEPESKAEYNSLSPGPGRFESLIKAAGGKATR
jgi:hypothetical protein